MRYILMFVVLLLSVSESGVGQWMRVAYPGTWISALLVKGDTVLAGSRDLIFRSTDGGTNWETRAQLSTISVSAFAQLGDTLFVSTDRARSCLPGMCDPIPSLFRSTDQGATWSTVLNAVYGANKLQKTSTALYTLADAKLFRSNRNGITWEQMTLDTTIGSAVEFLFAHAESLYIYTRQLGFHKSTDDGNTWQVTGSGLPEGTVYSMAVRDANLYAVIAGNGVFRSIDYGVSWSEANAGLSQAGAVHTLFAYDNALFAIAGDSVYLATTNDSHWQIVSDGLNLTGFRFVSTLAASDRYLFAGTNDGIWRRPLSEIITSVGKENDHTLPQSFALHQNYPNPFNPTTIISFELPVASWVSLKIFNVLGQEVTTLVNEEKRAGRYQVQWDANRMPSGVYFYHMVLGNRQAVRRLTLIK